MIRIKKSFTALTIDKCTITIWVGWSSERQRCKLLSKFSASFNCIEQKNKLGKAIQFYGLASGLDKLAGQNG